MACLLAGCRSPLSHAVERTSLDARYTMVAHPDLPAAKGDEGCGAQALAVALARFDPAIDVQQLCDALPWHDSGATVVDLIVAARKRGYEVSLHQGTVQILREAVAADHIALVLLDVQTEVWSVFGWWSSAALMHWAVVSGTSDDAIVLAGRGRSYLVEATFFDARWAASSRCTLIVAGKK
ncbi:MAG: hypothetical protein JNK15_18170 [Planctomycetes bacterium]|nr:hypothetical protein [Planctomycetota bacterium]